MLPYWKQPMKQRAWVKCSTECSTQRSTQCSTTANARPPHSTQRAPASALLPYWGHAIHCRKRRKIAAIHRLLPIWKQRLKQRANARGAATCGRFCCGALCSKYSQSRRNLLRLRFRQRLQAEDFTNFFVHDPAAARQHRAADNVVVAVELEIALLVAQVLQK